MTGFNMFTFVQQIFINVVVAKLGNSDVEAFVYVHYIVQLR